MNTKFRELTLHAVLSQDRTFFDQPKNFPQNLVKTFIKNTDDAKNIVSVVYGQIFFVIMKLGVGSIWILVLCWQLALAGLGITPIFVFARLYGFLVHRPETNARKRTSLFVITILSGTSSLSDRSAAVDGVKHFGGGRGG